MPLFWQYAIHDGDPATVQTFLDGSGGALAVFTSHPASPNPFIASVDPGDGQQLDLVEATNAAGAATVRIIDALSDPANPARRVFTDLLADANAEQQTLSRLATLDLGDTETGTTVRYLTGYLTKVTLEDALVWANTVGDTDRVDAITMLDTEVPPEEDGAWGQTAILGGPVVNGGVHLNPPQNSFRDYGPQTWVVDAAADDVLRCRLVSGYFAPWYDGAWTGDVGSNELASVNGFAADYFVPDESEWQGAKVYGWFPDLVVRCEVGGAGSGDVRRARPIAAPCERVRRLDGTVTYVGGRDRLISTTHASTTVFGAPDPDATWLFLWWPESEDSYPTGEPIPPRPGVGETLSVIVYPKVVSAAAPRHEYGHPVDLTAGRFAALGIRYDADSAAAVADAVSESVGADESQVFIPGTGVSHARSLKVARRSGPVLLKDYASGMGALFGFAWRFGAQGERVFVATRDLEGVAWNPVQTITINDLRDPSPTIWSLDESSVVKGISVKLRRYEAYDRALDLSDDGFTDEPMDGVTEYPADVEAVRETEEDEDGVQAPVDLARAFSDRVLSFDVPGEVVVGPAPLAVPHFARELGDLIVAQRGRGVVTTELACLPSVVAEVGDLVYLRLKHLPAALAGRTPAAQRIEAGNVVQPARVVKRTPRPEGPDLVLEHVGAAFVPVPPPEPSGEAVVPVPAFLLEVSGLEPCLSAQATLVNAEELAAVGAAVEWHWGLADAAGALPPPVTTHVFASDPATEGPTVFFDAPTAGLTIQVRARAVDPRAVAMLDAGTSLGALSVELLGFALSEWSDWEEVTLDEFCSGVPGEPGGPPGGPGPGAGGPATGGNGPYQLLIPITAPGAFVVLPADGAPLTAHSAQGPVSVTPWAYATGMADVESGAGSIRFVYGVQGDGAPDTWADLGPVVDLASAPWAGSMRVHRAAIPDAARAAPLIVVGALSDGAEGAVVGNVSVVFGAPAADEESDPLCCGLVGGASPAGFWAETFADVADTAAWDAAWAAGVEGDVFYAFSGIDYAIDPAEPFCAHASMASTLAASTFGGAAWGWYFFPIGELDLEAAVGYADAWSRVWVKIPLGMLEVGLTSVTSPGAADPLPLASWTANGQNQYVISLGLDGGDLTFRTSTNVVQAAGGAGQVVTGDWVQVISHLVLTGGGGFTLTAWVGPACGPVASVGAFSGATGGSPAGTSAIYFACGKNTPDDAPGTFWWGEPPELIDGLAHPDPFGSLP